MHPNFAERLFAELLRHPAREVLRWPAPGQPAIGVTGAGLLARVAAWQRALAAAGPLTPGTPVLLAHPGSPELVAALLAVQGLGAVPVLPPARPTLRQLLALGRAEGIRLVVTTPRVRRRWSWLAGLLGWRCVAAAPAPATYQQAALGDRPALRPVAPDQAALVSHSSGSASGRPALVRRSHRVLQAQHEALRQQFPPWAGQRDFPLFPNVLLHNLAVGALSLVPDLPGGQLARLSPARIVAQLTQEGVETLTGNVFYFQALVECLRRQPATFPRVRALGIGGSPVPEALLAALPEFFPHAARYVIYGASEAEPIAVRLVAGPAPDPRRGYCVGPPVAGLQLRLREPAPGWLPGLAAGPAPLTGEIEVRGPHVALPPGAPGAWLATGDFGYLDALGQLWLTGRRGAAALVRGVGHYQLEHYLRHQPGVRQVAARPTPQGFEVFVAGAAATAALQAAVAEAFGPGLLGQVHRRAQLPVDSRHFSKIRYDQLR